MILELKNLAMAVLAAKTCGLKENLIYRVINKLKDVSGRQEIREISNNIKVFVDYAHTPDALSKTLLSLKNQYGKYLYSVWVWWRKR